MPDTFRAPASLAGFRFSSLRTIRTISNCFAVFLRQCGAHVATAQTPRAALDYLDGQRIDAILTDVSVLTGMSPIRFVREVRNRPKYKWTPVIAVTGWVQKRAVCGDSGFTAFMQKPVELDDLAAMIR
jgi:two-component system, chemotaxis family, chemotaxis protein CheY